ncbi:glycosyl hydrolase [Proteiniphilum sp. UBA5384]|uniref:glycosyl hydrolase n=1 Tax=Proteiniphilum sp. UBA5384 TaxID=1947279 RepID=UPI0025F7FB0F|nr:glycosyl hydrolase [Proteiniphilum sp. UBA5384]
MEATFIHPPDSVKPWVFWDWISDNVTQEGITNDLESMKEVGIGGVVWRGIGGLWWAPEGEAKPYTPEWNNLMQWSIQEADRLGIGFTISQDFGYGSGGPHITPDNSMQQLIWNDTVIDGGSQVNIDLRIPAIPDENIAKAWLRPGEKLSDKVLSDIELIDSYRDIAILAIPYSTNSSSYKIPQLELRSGLGIKTYFNNLDKISPPTGTVIKQNELIDLSELLDSKNHLNWNAPLGKWRIIRIGHASNFLMTRPCPQSAVGLECNRLSKQGIDSHFKHFLQPILDQSDTLTGKTLTHLFLDSWEAGCQNWTQEMPLEFKNRRGYDITPWLPVLTGSVVESAMMSERFLWDFRQTVSELFLDNYLYRLQELVEPYGMKFSVEAYGRLSINTLQFAEMGDFPISEFWTLGDDKFPEISSDKYYNSMKAMASSAHTTGKVHVGAEAFTGNRGWQDHPFIFKGAGDEAFCRGVNHFFLHLSAHQAYEDMIPGLTHQKWGGHFNRFNTWWKFSKPWFDYIARCQYLLKQGQFVADICYFYGEGAPLSVSEMTLDLPPGYDYDFCSADILQQMKVKNERIVLPSGMSYEYLLLPNYAYLTLPSMQKIDDLIQAGAKVIGQERVIGTPGLTGYPENDKEVKKLADRLWNSGKIQMADNWETIFRNNNNLPDFVGEGLDYIHRKFDEMDIYFVSNPLPDYRESICEFRVESKTPWLWNPETGEISSLPITHKNGKIISLKLAFDPMQSWFIIFSNNNFIANSEKQIFKNYKPIIDISKSWQVQFDPNWGAPKESILFEDLADWRSHEDIGIKFYSGTATYKNKFVLTPEQVNSPAEMFIDLGRIEIMAKVFINEIECGIAWKPPYRVNITEAVHSGENRIEIEVVNTWVNRMIGDEHLPEDCEWIDWIRLKRWPQWFLEEAVRSSGRYTFTTVKHYRKEDALQPSGLLGPVNIVISDPKKEGNRRHQNKQNEIY